VGSAPLIAGRGGLWLLLLGLGREVSREADVERRRGGGGEALQGRNGGSGAGRGTIDSGAHALTHNTHTQRRRGSRRRRGQGGVGERKKEKKQKKLQRGDSISSGMNTKGDILQLKTNVIAFKIILISYDAVHAFYNF
jgi:hypothetical protein